MKPNAKTPILALLSVALLSCGSTPAESKQKEMCPDNGFQLGFTVNAASGDSCGDDHWPLPVDLTYGDNEGGATGWVVEQHGCNHGLGDVYNKSNPDAKPTYENGTYTYQDASKVLAVNPEKKSLYLELNASQEYSHARRSGEAWPHLILCNGLTVDNLFLKDVNSLTLSMDFTLRKEVNCMGDEFNSGLHTTQFVMNLTAKTTAALDGDNYFWFSIPLYDYRYPKGTPEGGQIDTGKGDATGMYIFHMGMSEALPNGTPLGVTEHLSFDLVPHLQDGLIATINAGRMTHTTINDLYISGFNIGFEIPGTFDSGIEIANFSLLADYK